MKKKIFLAGIFSFITSWGAQSLQSGGECAQVSAPSVALTGGVEDVQSLVADHRFFCTKDKCEDICDDIYSKSSNEKVCSILSESLIQSLEETDWIFEDSDPDKLAEINPLAISVYLDISVNPLVEHIKNYSERELKDFLTWIASVDSVSGRSAVSAISKADRNFEILEELLDEWGRYKDWRGHPSQRSVYEYALMQRIDERGTFFDLIRGSFNWVAGHWVHRFIEKAHCQFDKLCTLQTYCILSEAMSKDFSLKPLIRLPYFAKFIDSVITEGVNKSNWADKYHQKKQKHQSFNKLNLWSEDLCSGLI